MPARKTTTAKTAPAKTAAAKKTTTKKTPAAKAPAKSTTKTAAKKPTASKTTEAKTVRAVKDDAFYKRAVDASHDVAKENVAYIFGNHEPFVYMAVSDGTLNFTLWKYGSSKTKEGEIVERWSWMRKYASTLDHAARVFYSDAQKTRATRARKQDILETLDAVMQRIATIEQTLMKITPINKD